VKLSGLCKGAEEWVGLEGFGGELRMKLTGHEERVIREFDDLDEIAVR